MSCDEYQRTISKLHDGELHRSESAPVFGHLAECPACREFYHAVQETNRSLDRMADTVPEGLLREFRPPVIPALMRPQTLWSRQVPLRLPVLAIMLCVVLASLFMSFSTETVYVSKLPTTVVTAQQFEAPPKN